ncbi:dihydroxyacetone kinase subunit DhaL [Candidatus Methylocalor cossyra]|uniref:Phosphoenolpyruvate-dihydroxyacetone phosphotransferase, ADP-binding subunit DhaL n=1 Tax=Candidatus Methylocalor cossyra TaxID=3108543 RepID=A0ABM9NH28_9GAMM
MPVSTARIPTFILAADRAVRAHAEEIAALDQAIGDGDHLANLQRGLAALEASAARLATLDWPTALNEIGRSLMSTVGGASGSLYATLFVAMGKALPGRAELDLPALAAAFAQGVLAVKQRGKAERGQKTMLDVLIPVADALQAAAAAPVPLAQALEQVREAAAAGCEATRDLVAVKGRASFLGERARGYLDPGAKTSALMIQGIVESLAATLP